MITTLNLTDITVDTECQMRAGGLTPETVIDYAEVMTDGGTFPAITVYHDGVAYWLADGFHRVAAAHQAGIAIIEADIRQGGKVDAKLHAVGANSDHGLRRTNADKRKAVQAVLDEPTMAEASDREIARICKVTHPFVAKVRRDRGGNGYQPDEIEARRRLFQVELMGVESQLHDTMHRFKATALSLVQDLDAVRGMLTPDQYHDWLVSEFGIDGTVEARLRRAVAAGNDDEIIDACMTFSRDVRELLEQPA